MRSLMLCVALTLLAPIATPTIHGMGELDRTIESSVHFDHVHPDYDENTPASYQELVDTSPGDPDTVVEPNHEIDAVTPEATVAPRAPPTFETVSTPVSENPPQVDRFDDSESTEAEYGSEPSPTPFPPATEESFASFSPTLSCNLPEGRSPTFAGSPIGSTYACSLLWVPVDLVSIEVALIGELPAGWTVALAKNADAPNPDTGASRVLDLGAGDFDDHNAEFVLNATVNCTAAKSALLSLQVSGTTSRGVESVVASVPVSAGPPPVPVISVNDVAFSTVDTVDGDVETIGSISLNYQIASLACGWNLSLGVSQFTLDDVSAIPAGSLSLISVSSLPYVETPREAGSIAVSFPPLPEGETTGTITLTVSLHVPGTTPEGTYAGTITVNATGPGDVP